MIRYAALGSGSYGRTEKNVCKVVGKQVMKLYAASVIWDLANRGRSKRDGGINQHPMLDSIKCCAGDLVKNRMLDDYEDAADEWLRAMTKHGNMLKDKMATFVTKKHENRPRIQLGVRKKE